MDSPVKLPRWKIGAMARSIGRKASRRRNRLRRRAISGKYEDSLYHVAGWKTARRGMQKCDKNKMDGSNSTGWVYNRLARQ